MKSCRCGVVAKDRGGVFCLPFRHEDDVTGRMSSIVSLSVLAGIWEIFHVRTLRIRRRLYHVSSAYCDHCCLQDLNWDGMSWFLEKRVFEYYSVFESRDLFLCVETTVLTAGLRTNYFARAVWSGVFSVQMVSATA